MFFVDRGGDTTAVRSDDEAVMLVHKGLYIDPLHGRGDLILSPTELKEPGNRLIFVSSEISSIGPPILTKPTYART